MGEPNLSMSPSGPTRALMLAPFAVLGHVHLGSRRPPRLRESISIVNPQIRGVLRSKGYRSPQTGNRVPCTPPGPMSGPTRRAGANMMAPRAHRGQSARVAKTGGQRDGPDDGALLALFGAIASCDDVEIARRLESSRDLASRPIRVGASRQDAETYFLGAIRHYVYGGDTALHIAAAAHQRELAESLVTRGADVRARNRRGAEPLHYAADGSPGGALGSGGAA